MCVKSAMNSAHLMFRDFDLTFTRNSDQWFRISGIFHLSNLLYNAIMFVLAMLHWRTWWNEHWAYEWLYGLIPEQKSRAMQAELENEWPGPAYFIYHAYACKHGKDLQLSEQARLLMHLSSG
jgi:hypothetical protein